MAARPADEQDIAQALERLIRRVLNEPVDVTLTLTRQGGDQRIEASWQSSGWEGRLILTRVRPREISAKELQGILGWLQSSERAL